MDKKPIDATTEGKIKEAARIVFTKKGYDATKVRDIAAEADINLSLVNYYFRSKENLFRLIMAETVQKLVAGLREIINNEQLSLQEKIGEIVDYYTKLLLDNPDFPSFVVTEILNDPERFTNESGVTEALFQSHFVKQLMALRSDNKISFNPINIMVNLMGMIIFPFLVRPAALKAGVLKEEDFRQLMDERKRLIPGWIKMMTET